MFIYLVSVWFKKPVLSVNMLDCCMMWLCHFYLCDGHIIFTFRLFHRNAVDIVLIILISYFAVAFYFLLTKWRGAF